VNSGGVQDASWTNFFGVPAHPDDDAFVSDGSPLQLSWESNLHMYHLQRTGALCHECHYNIHSNAEAQNTIFGDGTGCVANGTPPCPLNSDGTLTAALPPDNEDGIADGISDTHLINFAPPDPAPYSGERRCDQSGSASPADYGPEGPGSDVACAGAVRHPNPNATGFEGPPPPTPKANVFEGVEGVTADRPVWYYATTISNNLTEGTTPYPVFRCNLRCHGVVMSTCFYIGNADRTLNRRMNRGTLPNGNQVDTWCAGGRDQIAPITVGSAPPQIKQFLAQLGQGFLSGGIAAGAKKRASHLPTQNDRRASR
jgi:hypothetical protein